MYFKYFQSRLEWWVVSSQWRDVFLVPSSVSSLGFETLTALSFLCLLASAALLAVSRWRVPFFARRWQGAAGALVLFLPLLVVHQARLTHPELLHRLLGTPLSSQASFSPIREQIQENWFLTWKGKASYGVTFGEVKDLSAEQTRATLAKFRDPNAEMPRISREELAKKLRRELGLPTQGPLHVAVVLVESFRDREYRDPRFGRALFPNLHRLADGHATYFSNAYSSSAKAGQTVRGLFSTLCSFLPDVFGPATIIHNPGIRLDCLQKSVGRQGYKTGWFAAHNKEFHREGDFEKAQQVQVWKDLEHYKALGFPLFDIGVTDEKHFPQLAEEMRGLVALEPKTAGSFFHSINLGTHHPWHRFENDPLIPEVASKLDPSAAPIYANYLKTLHLMDRAAGEMIEKIFAQDFGDRALVVLLGDHSISQEPDLPLTHEERQEMYFKIPIFFFTKNHPNPGASAAVVQQIDVAPTIFDVLGLEKPPTWMGHNALLAKGQASPFLFFDENHGLYFRDRERTCFQRAHGQYSCRKDGELSYREEDLASSPQAEFYLKVLHAAALINRYGRVENSY
jgi:arylsulfatase A-like enzyme